MADKVMKDFYHRVARIERAHEKRNGFDAARALGRSHYAPPRRLRPPVIAPVLVVLACILLLKGMIYAGLGAQDYEARAAALWDGGAIDRFGAVIMQPDPVSTWLAGQIGAALR